MYKTKCPKHTVTNKTNVLSTYIVYRLTCPSIQPEQST